MALATKMAKGSWEGLRGAAIRCQRAYIRATHCLLGEMVARDAIRITVPHSRLPRIRCPYGRYRRIAGAVLIDFVEWSHGVVRHLPHRLRWYARGFLAQGRQAAQRALIRRGARPSGVDRGRARL